MRLKSIRLSGFKSFADSITLSFPKNLCAVVGPNGCGKSNIIDAVRWVLGESSAKRLRGETMAEVIFNGSESRKPSAMASVELLFDNSGGHLGKEYSSYTEIEVRRQVTSEGQSRFFLNGRRCRRHDITSMFAGTGLGSRGYSIIEQGSISRITEAKPQELRAFVEEAAGISFYQQMRQETETQLRHVHENLERVKDKQDILGERLLSLRKQARIAKRYATLTSKKSVAEGLLLALRWKDLETSRIQLQDECAGLREKSEEASARQQEADSALEHGQQERKQKAEQEGRTRSQYYDLSAKISSAEEILETHRKNEKRVKGEKATVASQRSARAQELKEQQEALTDLESNLTALESKLARAVAADLREQQQLDASETGLASFQEEWNLANQAAVKAREALSKLHTEAAKTQWNLDRLGERQRSLLTEQSAIAEQSPDAELSDCEKALRQSEKKVGADQKKLDALAQQGQKLGEQLLGQEEKLRQARRDLDEKQGRLASLQALQSQALEKTSGDLSAWLRAAGIEDCPTLAEKIRIEPGWETALEAVLGNRLQFRVVPDLDKLAPLLADMPANAPGLLMERSDTAPSEPSDPASIVTLIEGAEIGFLEPVKTVPTLKAAMALRASLMPGESVVTQDGVQVGHDWICIRQDEQVSGVLIREQQIKELQEALRAGQDEEQALQKEQERLHEESTANEHQARLIGEALARCREEVAALRASCEMLRARAQEHSIRRSQLAKELQQIERSIGESAQEQQAAQLALQKAEEEGKALEENHQRLQTQGSALQTKSAQARKAATESRDARHQLETQLERLKASRQSLTEACERLTNTLTELGERETMLASADAADEEKARSVADDLTAKQRSRKELEDKMHAERQEVDRAEERLQTLGQERMRAGSAMRELQERLNEKRLQTQDVESRQAELAERLRASGHDLSALSEKLTDDASHDALNDLIQSLSDKLERLGPVNLAASSDYEEQDKERSAIDQQVQDLESAVSDLEAAIEDIDKESRTRFNDSLEAINASLQRLFSRVFGGGQARLRLAEGRAETGLIFQASPPGKRPAHVSMLSGGEKALSAIAMVFAMLERNPAPFCLLDEIDAPLDDANATRYAELLRDVGSRTQFIYITHNKLSMEAADSMVGVTMLEKGISALVAADFKKVRLTKL